MPPRPPLLAASVDRADLAEPWVRAGAPGATELLRRLVGWPAVVARRWDLVAVSVRRDLQARFRGTLLGFAWVLAHPLLLFAVYAFVFTELLGVRLAAGEGVPAGSMGVYMFTGTLCWSAFADAVQRSTSCIVEGRNLVQKVRFPAELLPLEVGLSSLVTLAAGVAAFTLFTGVSAAWPAPGLELLAWGPVLLLLQLLFTTGLGLALSAIHVVWRDTLPLVGVALTVGMLATPVFWVPSPEVLPGIERRLPLVEATPPHHLVRAWREVLLGGEPALAFARGSLGESVRYVALWAVGAFVLGSLVFFRQQPQLADEV